MAARSERKAITLPAMLNAKGIPSDAPMNAASIMFFFSLK